MNPKNVLIIGGGVAGLTTATQLARLGATTTVVDKAPFMGGHAISFTCKATDRCVKCGACMAQDRLSRAIAQPAVKLMTFSRLTGCYSTGKGYEAEVETAPRYVDPDRCTACGVCMAACPQGAVVKGYSMHHTPFFAIDPAKCEAGRGCEECKGACPEKAIDLNVQGHTKMWSGDAIVVATGFQPFDPTGKPYGYGVFPNVITTLEMERMLRRYHRVIRPSDGETARSIAFIQCVGSRDLTLNHNWCSKVCCSSALRMATRILHDTPQAEISCFYIDIQTFGKDFDRIYAEATQSIKMIRTIPADIYPADQGNLKVIYTETQPQQPVEALFDLVVLSVGMTPNNGLSKISGLLGIDPPIEGFGHPSLPEGLFSAGSVNNPMNIAQAIADAGRATWETAQFLGLGEVS